jgi:hypothetical protein
MEHDPRRNKELTAPAELLRDDLPFNPAEAANDEPDTDVELAEDEAPGPEQQFSGD